MSGKIFKRVTSLVCVCLLISGLFVNTQIEAKDSDTNYKIDVQNTQEGTFVLTGNMEEVPDDITLMTLSDEFGNQYDPAQFQIEVREERTYTFDLKYKNPDEEIKQETVYVMTESAQEKEEETETSPDESQQTDEEWIKAENNVFQLATKYSEDHSYMEVRLENISGKDVYDIASIMDENGNDYTSTTSWCLNEVGTYTYEIKYYDNETGNKVKEVHQIVVEDIQEPTTISLDILQEKADTGQTISMYAYQYGSGKKIQEEALTVPAGMISEHESSFALSGYAFKGVYVKRGGENGELYQVTSIYVYNSNIYYTVDDKSATQPSIAYRLSQDEELGAYYLKDGVDTTYTLKNGVGNDPEVKVQVVAMDLDSQKEGYQVYEGVEVAIRVDYDKKYQSVELLLNGKSESYVKKEEYLVDNYTIFTFEMPKNDVTFTLRKNNYTSDQGLLAIVDGDSAYFNTTEVGLSSFGSFDWMGATNSLNGSDIVYSVGRGQWCGYGGDKKKVPGSTTVNPFKNVLTTIPGDTNQDAYINGGVYGGVGTLVEGEGPKQVNEHRGTNSSGGEVKSPVATFERGQDLNFTYLVKRVNVGTEGDKSKVSQWGMYEPYYDYRFNNLYIEYFPNQGDNVLNPNDFTNQNGNTIVRENIKVPAFGKGNTAVTRLRNGAEVTVKIQDSVDVNLNNQNLIDTSDDPKIKSDTQWQKIYISITGLYDDFRLTASSSSSIHKYVTFQNVDGVVNPTNEVAYPGETVSYVPVKGSSTKDIQTGLTLVAANDSPNGDGVFEFILNPIDGYSIPKLTKYSYTGEKEEIEYGTDTDKVEIVKDNFPDSDGLYHYKYKRAKESEFKDRIKYFDITSNPISFIVDYTDITNKPPYVTNKTKFDVTNNSYFSVPNDVPTKSSMYFDGWGIKVIDTSESNSSNNDNRYLKDENGEIIKVLPGDLISVSYLYDRMQDNNFMQQSDIGKSEYKIMFVAQWSNNIADGAYKTDGQINIYNQNAGVTSYDGNNKPNGGYKQPTKKDGTLIDNQKYIVGADIVLGNYPTTKTIDRSTYILNEDKSILSMRTTTDPLIGYLTYDKAISVTYNLNGGSGQKPTDSNNYTTVSGHNSQITLSDVEPTKPNEEFIGWKIVSGSYESEIYKYSPSDPSKNIIDLSTLDNNLRNSIFTNGTVEFVAQYQSSVAVIKHTDDSFNRIDDKYSWIDENKNLTITKKFKYDGNNDSYQAAKTKGLIHTAIYQQDKGTGNYILQSSDVGSTQIIGSATLSDSLDSKSCFEVTYDISSKATYSDYNLDSFAIFAWSSANKADSFTDTTRPDSFAPTNNYGKVPFFIQQIYVLRSTTHVDGTTGQKDDNNEIRRQWSYETDESIVLTQEFKYDGDNTTFEAAKANKGNRNEKLHVALYRQESKDGGTQASDPTEIYKLLHSDLYDSNDPKISVNISELNEQKIYTVTYTIEKDVAYADDNYDRYAIFSWTGVNGNGNLTDTGIKVKSFSTTDYSFYNIPWVSQSVWVMEQIQAIDEDNKKQNQIVLDSLQYENDTSFQMEQIFAYDKRMTEDELKRSSNIQLYRRGADEEHLYLQYASGQNTSSNVPVIENIDPKNGTFKVTASNLPLSSSKKDTGAYWVLMCYNASNQSDDPGLTQDGNRQYVTDEVQTLRDYPNLKLTIYTINGTQIPDNMFSIPSQVQLVDQGEELVTSKELKIEIKGVYHSNENEEILVEDDPVVAPESDVRHNSNYTVNVEHDTGEVPQIQLIQEETNKEFYAYFYDSEGKPLTEDADELGTIGFKENGDPSSLSFRIKGKSPSDITTKDQFVGTGNYTITRNIIHK